MMMEKDKRVSNGEEDDFLQLLITDYEMGLVSTSPLLSPILSNTSSSYEETLPNPNQDVLSSNGGYEDYMVPKNVSSSSLSSSKGDYSFINEMEEVDEEEFYSKFLSLSNPVSPVIFSGSLKLPTENVSEDVNLDLIINPPQTTVQPPYEVTEAATTATKGRPKGRGSKKAMPPEKLVELSVQDPKKAKRIIMNRMSAVRAKERKKLYTFMLEHKIQTLQCEAASLSAHLALLQTESIGLSAENARLKQQTDNVLRHIRFQDSLNEEIRKEIQSLIMLTQNRDPEMTFNIGNMSAVYTQQFQSWLPNPYQVQKLDYGVEQINIINNGQQYLNWQFQRGQSTHHPQLQLHPNVEKNPPSFSHQADNGIPE